MWYKIASLRLLLVLAASVAVMAAFACAAAKEAEEPEAPAAAAAAKAAETAPAQAAAAAAKDAEAPKEAAPAAKAEEAAEAEEAEAAEKETAAVAKTEREAPEKMEEATGGEVTAATYVAPEQSPDVYYKATWQGVRPTTFQENPLFTQWAKDGVQDNGFGWKMEPLAERLPVPDDVMVIQPADEIGVYGGTWRLSLSGWLLDLRQYTDSGCLKTDADRSTMIAYSCKEWTTSEDGRVWSFRLREGHKWSDGAPLDMEVVRFTFEDMNANVGEGKFPRKGHPSFEDPVTGKLATWEAIDDLWFSLTFDSPYYNFKEGDSAFWASRCDRYCFFAHPSMKEMHEDYQDADVLAKMVKDAGVDDWVQLIRIRASYFDFQDTPYPNISHVYQSGGHGAAPSQQLLASPYHFAVDPAGNQLPYFDAITATNFESREVAVFRSMAGETDADAHQFELPEMPLYLANMEKGDYSIFHQVNGNGADSGLGFNTTFNNDKEIGMAMRTRKFRRAWSTALDREGMNEVAFLGLGTPQQIVPHPSNRYYPGDEWPQLDAENDPAKSIKLLGEAGWTDTDNDGFINRQDPFGTGDTGNLDLFMEIPIGGHVGDRALSQTDMIVAGVKDAGIKLDFTAKQGASVSDNQTYVGFGGSATINPWEGTGFGFPLGKWQAYASLIGLYHETQGKEGMGPTGPDPDFLPLSPAGRAPADTSGLMLDNQTIWKKGTQVPRSSPERTEWGKEIWRNLNTAKWELGIVAFSGANLGVMMKRNNFRNVARSQGPTRVGEFAEQYYFEDGKDNVNNPGNKSKKYKSVSFLTDDVYTRPEVR